MKKIKYLLCAFSLALSISACVSAQSSASEVLKKDSVFAVYMKAGYLYNKITESLVNLLKSNDVRLQKGILRKLASDNLFGITPSTGAESAVKLIQGQKFIPTGNLAFSITSELEGTCVMDVKCNPESLPGNILDFLDERGVKTDYKDNALILTTELTEQTGKLTSTKLTIGKLATTSDKPDKSWQVFESATVASGTLIAIEADIDKVKTALYKSISDSIREDCEANRKLLDIVVKDYNNQNETQITELTPENIKTLKNFAMDTFSECQSKGEYSFISDGSIECSLHGTKDNPKEYLSKPDDPMFKSIEPYIEKITRFRTLGNMSKLQAMICVNDESMRKSMLDMLKQQIDNMKNGIRDDDEPRSPENKRRNPPRFNGEQRKPMHRDMGRPKLGEIGDRQPRPPFPPQRPDMQATKDFASKIVVIDKSPWIGVEIPDFVNMISSGTTMLDVIAGPKGRPERPPRPPRNNFMEE